LFRCLAAGLLAGLASLGAGTAAAQEPVRCNDELARVRLVPGFEDHPIQVYIPTHPPKSAAGYPVVFFFHGITGDNSEGVHHYCGDTALAEEPSDPFIIISPQGKPRWEIEYCEPTLLPDPAAQCDPQGGPGWVSAEQVGSQLGPVLRWLFGLTLRGWHLVDPARGNNEDLPFVRAMLLNIGSLTRRNLLSPPEPIDRRRIYFTGHSMGGFLSHLAGQHEQELFEDTGLRLAGVGTNSSGLDFSMIYIEKEGGLVQARVPGGFDYIDQQNGTTTLSPRGFAVMLLADHGDPQITYSWITGPSIEAYRSVWNPALFDHHVYFRGVHPWHLDAYSKGACEDAVPPVELLPASSEATAFLGRPPRSSHRGVRASNRGDRVVAARS
jgi:poly(3-hydroxybutyrate) depolymerase